MTSKLENAYIIGSENFQNWSQGFDPTGYLRVLPHPDVKVPFKDPFKDWQEGKAGNYFSSWGPDKELNVTLRMSDLTQTKIDGFGILKSGDGIIPWFNNKETTYEALRGYNGTIPGPMIITEPGDKVNIWLENNLGDASDISNLHLHGLHGSPVGYGDNVLISLNPGESRNYSYEIPKNHLIGLNWYHPHLHGLTNTQLTTGLAGQLLVAPPHDLPDLNKWNPKEKPMYFMGINSFGVQQTNRVGKAGDPLNQDPSKAVPAGTPLQVLGNENGEKVYQLSDAVFAGYNAKPIPYDPAQPTGNPAQQLFEYGGGPLAEPVENVIHTVNGQYNPTLDLKTGEWSQFSFANMSSNAFHVIQLVRDDGEKLIPQKISLVGFDGDTSGTVAENRREVTETPILSSGQRISVQSWFEEPGTYYFLSNGTEEIMGDDAPSLIKGTKGFEDGHLKWAPQVLATVEVTGNSAPKGAFPEAYEPVKEQAQELDEQIAAAEKGEVDRQRTIIWSANIGGAIAQGRAPDDTDVSTFEGTYGINGEFFGTDFSESQVPLEMPMLDSTEVWTIKNKSGQTDPSLPVNIPLPEWHPFHIHQNEFAVLEINGIAAKNLKNSYLDGVFSDTVAIPPTYDPANPPTPDNPYGTPKIDGETAEVKLLMNFKDFPGSYVNHCHILFHEDAGMMQAVRVILNTKDTWLGLAPDSNLSGEIELLRAHNTQEKLGFTPYGTSFKGGIKVAIGDVNYKQATPKQYNVTDNVTDVITVESGLNAGQNKFTVKVFDGKTLIGQQENNKQKVDGQDPQLLLTEFTPFQNATLSATTKTSVAAGDIDGDGFSDIVVGKAGDKDPLIEIYSGKDYHLLTRLKPFHHEADFSGTINLASGDVDGDNFDDIIVGQGQGGRGLLEVYSGQSIQSKGSLDAKETAHEADLLSEAFQPYGASYQGEVKVTSGYILQRPGSPNSGAIQTYHANITTMATGNVPEGHQAVKVFTLLGGEHHSAAASSEHSHSSEEKGISQEIRMDAEFTPTSKLEEFSGTFADIPGLSKGEPVLFGLSSSDGPQLVRLQEENIAKSMDLSSDVAFQSSGDDLIYGDSGNNDLRGYLGNDTVNGLTSDDQLNGNQGQDILFASDGKDTVHGGKDDDVLYGNKDADVLWGDLGNDTLYGGKGDDTLFGGDGDDWLEGDLGKDALTGGGGRDRFLLEADTGTDTILDFQKGQDLLVLAGGLTFGQLSITQGNGATLIGIANTDKILASINGVQANLIAAEDFV